VILTNFLEALNKKATFTDKIDSIVEEKTAETVKYYEDLAEAYKMTLEQLASSAGFDSVDKLKEALKKDIQSEVKLELLLYAYGNAINFELSNEVAVEYLDALVMLQGEASREDVLTEYGVETIRSEVYSQALVDAIINNYK
jgi:FKBP-type peptidyl-prolyl cis-trans isomerase (trigger factor)